MQVTSIEAEQTCHCPCLSCLRCPQRKCPTRRHTGMQTLQVRTATKGIQEQPDCVSTASCTISSTRSIATQTDPPPTVASSSAQTSSHPALYTTEPLETEKTSTPHYATTFLPSPFHKSPFISEPSDPSTPRDSDPLYQPSSDGSISSLDTSAHSNPPGD